MAHVISDECVKRGACKETCPVQAISEGETKLVVDANTCVDCGACEGVCPTGAIKLLWTSTARSTSSPRAAASA